VEVIEAWPVRPGCDVKTGREQGMKESYGEGLANHTGPESCGGAGNGTPASCGPCSPEPPYPCRIKPAAGSLNAPFLGAIR